MAQFINQKEKLVQDALDGLLRASGGAKLARLDGFPGIKVIMRTDHKPSRVAIIAGGGSGHEPAHASFVGAGMLTAAVAGEIFASPSIDAVFAAIMAVTGPGGCLLIFKNYTGDRLNFGLAVERARSLGKKVEVVIVKDDIAIPGIAQPRGVAGVVFVEKIAGHFAEKGWPLHKVAKIAQDVADAAVSLGLALSSCTIPGIGREDRVPLGKAELGLGIHGEPGVELIGFEDAAKTARALTDRLFKRARPAKSYALLVNNLGSTTPLEMALLTNEVLAGPHGKKIKLVCGPANLVTSLDMHGFSFSLLPLKPEWEVALQSPASPLVWPKVYRHEKPKLVKLPKESKIKTFKPSKNPALAATLAKACDIIIAHEKPLNALDARVGDGDTGSTLATAARYIHANIGKLPLAKQDDFFAALSQAMTHAIGGSSGVLLAIFFSSAGQSTGKNWKAALQFGLEKMMAYGGAGPGHRTMIDALAPSLAALSASGDLNAAAQAARTGANATGKMTRAQAGRSSYVSADNLAGINDPGAEAVALLLEGLAKA
ncbi:dihydroxyacetone kinase subunit DhaK [Aestuariivirga litoralis]|uniref:dihydroxyacetone kinase subunit DhaK n=1 Tax=Aestuariivirga litoralis TaxID=2650924 RepID=UPI0018C56589|nr:dihydroxyacetone kinase subunit DhaK [Aestuariivirga litoralis]MBG1232391.1 DAK2 domain-containing protein [Aestuariivirga litoralis]